MTNYYKYVPVSKDDENWGLCVQDAGCNTIHPGEVYPPLNHPMHHYFKWEKGRILTNEYQIIYITKGQGFFESASCKLISISAGSIFILFPGEWHRFKPAEETGWDEYWVGCKGEVIDKLVKNNFFSVTAPVLQVGIKEELVSRIIEIINNAKEERTGYQPLIAGAVLHLLGQIHAICKKELLPEDSIETLVNKARFLLRENIDGNTSVEKIADELNVSYSWLRKAFKAYTGLAPGQYFIQLKIERAKLLLADPSKSIKEIAYGLQFDSGFYFSRLFKEKTGITPKSYRKQQQG